MSSGQYVATRPFPTTHRQYEIGDMIDTSRITSSELNAGVTSGAIEPAKFIDTAARLAALNPALGPGVHAYETDTGVHKIGTDGVTRYNDLDQVGNATYGRTVASVYVDNYGTVGDGATDDTAAIQAAITACPAGGTVIFGPKTYLHTGLTASQMGISLRGAGRGLTILKLATGATASNLSLNPTGTTFKNPFAVEEMDLVGVATSSHGIHVRYASLLALTNVRIHSHGGDGIRTYESTVNTFTQVEVRSNAGNGISFAKKTDASTLLGCSIFLNGGWGMQVGTDTAESGGNGRCNGVFIAATTFLQNVGGGLHVRVASTNGVRLAGCYFENNQNVHVQIGENGGGTVQAASISDSYFSGGATTPIAVQVWNVNHIAFDNNFVESPNTGAVKLNVANTNWSWRGSVCSNGYGVQDSAGVNYSAADINGRFTGSSMRLGPAPTTAVADLTIDRNDTSSNQMLRVIQSGAGSAGASLLAVSADGTTTTQQAAYFRSKGTGNIAVFANGSGNVLHVTTTGAVVLNNGPQWLSGTGTPEGAKTAPIGSIYSRTDGGAGTSLYVKESGAGNTGWVAK